MATIMSNPLQSCAATIKDMQEQRKSCTAEIAALEEECQRLRGDFGPEDGRFAIATYQLEQRFHIPADATSWEVKWGMLRYWTADGETHEAPPFAGETFEDWDAEYMKRR